MSNKLHLTEQEQKFVEHYSIHGKPTAAYLYAEYSDMSPQLNATEAQKILKRPHVALRLYEIQVAATELISVSVAQKKQWLKTIIEKSLEIMQDPKSKKHQLAGDLKAAITAIAELNKMDGDLAAQKKEITGAIGISIDSDDDDL
jgi:phage terminase small subunit